MSVQENESKTKKCVRQSVESTKAAFINATAATTTITAATTAKTTAATTTIKTTTATITTTTAAAANYVSPQLFIF